ncbi:hypothetical protein [Xanthomarina sp. GH4-25]|uniref:hypothetical protein n=1 Tax=Xanthomarina sp. GH4-25 TaxID=3349335 RepID=UPI003877F683
MKKVCIFCGDPPQNKNKEHIIPRWLMKLTDTEKKDMSVGSNWKEGKEIVFNFASFTFPSCTKCNSDFAQIESLVRPIIEKILIDEYVSVPELEILLDWFDKVRISLWLGIQFHNKGTFNMDPKYYINNRVGLKDRFLAITNCYDNYKGLKWTGANTLCFIMSPTCFTLKINNILFTNCSSDFIVSKQLGFPYPAFERPNPNSHLTDFQLLIGTNKTQKRIFNSKLHKPNIIISQPMFKVAKGHFDEYYDYEYIKNNSYEFENGIGKIFLTERNKTEPLERDEEVCFASEQSNVPKRFKLNKPTLELQIELLTSKKYNLDLLNDTQKKQHFEGLNGIINYTKEQIKQYNY